MVKNRNNIWDEEENTPTSSKSLQLGSDIIDTEFVKKFAECWKNDMALKSKGCELLKNPFKSAIIQGLVFNEEVIAGLVEEMINMEWTRKQMDLYEFHQTTDLANVQSGLLSEFYQFLNNGELFSH